jgi:hypothetical protein
MKSIAKDGENNMSDNFFGQAEEISDKVKKGEISGSVTWPLTGTARLVGVEKTYKSGTPYLVFKLAGEAGLRDFFVRIPQAGDKDAAKFMGMQKIYKTLFLCGRSDPSTVPVGTAFENAQKAIGNSFTFDLEEYDQVSQKNGQTYTNQSLVSLRPALQSEGGLDL